MRRQLADITGMWERVNAGAYSDPARVRLLDAINDRLKPITDLDPLTDLGGAGLTFREWLGAVELRRRVILAVDDLDA